MPRTAGIFKRANGWEVDKVVNGQRLRRTFDRLSDAEAFVQRNSDVVRRAQSLGERPVITLGAAAARYVDELVRDDKPSAATAAWVFKSMFRSVDPTQPQTPCQTPPSMRGALLRPSPASVPAPRPSETVYHWPKTVLKAAHARWKVPHSNLSLLAAVPTLVLPPLDDQRKPMPITWVQQDALLAQLPPHLAAMSLFALHTGARENVIVSLQWEWRVTDGVFFVPKQCVKGRRDDQLLFLNSVAQRVVQQQIGKHPEYVFVWRRERSRNLDKPPRMPYRPLLLMNNTAWESARTRAGLGDLHVHDLRHTFASRLRKAEVSERTVRDLLWHSSRSVTQHYMHARETELLDAVERIAQRPESDEVQSLEQLKQAARARIYGGLGKASGAKALK